MPEGRAARTARLFIVEITTADGKHQSFECEYPLLQLISQVLQTPPIDTNHDARAESGHVRILNLLAREGVLVAHLKK